MSEFNRLDIMKQLKDKYIHYLSVDLSFFNEANTTRTLCETMDLIRKLLENERS